MNRTMNIVVGIISVVLIFKFSTISYDYLECNSFKMIGNQLCYGLLSVIYTTHVCVSVLMLKIFITITKFIRT